MTPHVCPWWLGYFLASPLRRLVENPNKLLDGLITPGMTVLDVGCAMGFFTMPAARMVGSSGRVIAVDIQPKMISALRRRAKRRGLLDRIETRVGTEQGLGLSDLASKVDLVLAIHMVHEVPDRDRLMSELCRAVKHTGKMLIVEPKGHVKAAAFAETVAAAERAGFRAIDLFSAKRGHSRLFVKA
ncbi:MAG: class I SAM-dependent methyltransferase [candidate division Zixibacteria bacterium]|nr:class I SAM-dependent methyltransferase [candidate division Zixibacteria bacterium]